MGPKKGGHVLTMSEQHYAAVEILRQEPILTLPHIGISAEMQAAADHASVLTPTVAGHLSPKTLLDSESDGELSPDKLRRLATLGTENCFRRMACAELNDVLLQCEFVAAANDISVALGEGPITPAEVDKYLNKRLLLPSFRIITRTLSRKRSIDFKDARKLRPVSLRCKEDLGYDEQGILVRVTVVSDLRSSSGATGIRAYYRECDRLIEGASLLKLTPYTNLFQASAPFFAFSLVWPLLQVRRVMKRGRITIDLDSTTPADLLDAREKFIAELTSVAKGCGAPEFCHYSKCRRILDWGKQAKPNAHAFLRRGGFPAPYRGQAYCSRRCCNNAKAESHR